MRTLFYIPRHHAPKREEIAAWERSWLPAIKRDKRSTSQSWLYQTWNELREGGGGELVMDMPESGTIITLSNFLPPGFRAAPGQFVVAIVADYVPHPGAQVQIVQNAAHARRLAGAIFMPHWPQPHLLPRGPLREDRIERAAFFGDIRNIAPELASPGFAQRLQAELGVRLEIIPVFHWHDYSGVDVSLAVRDFSPALHLNKPASKLYNAWQAGVPLIAGRDSAFAAEGEPGRDYLVARSADDCLHLIRKLREEPGLRCGIVKAGKEKAAHYSREKTRDRWRKLIDVDLPELSHQWDKRSPASRAHFWLCQKARFFVDRHLRS